MLLLLELVISPPEWGLVIQFSVELTVICYLGSYTDPPNKLWKKYFVIPYVVYVIQGSI